MTDTAKQNRDRQYRFRKGLQRHGLSARLARLASIREDGPYTLLWMAPSATDDEEERISHAWNRWWNEREERSRARRRKQAQPVQRDLSWLTDDD